MPAMIHHFVLYTTMHAGAALTIPSTLALSVRFFPKPKAQAQAIGGSGGVGGVRNGEKTPRLYDSMAVN